MPHKPIKYSLILAIVALLLFTSVASASGGPPRLNGRWVETDRYDGSTINMILAGPPGGPFRVNWTESYFSLCGSRFGKGTGTAEVVDTNTLYLVVDFECFRNSNSAHFEDTLYYDPATRTLDSLTDPIVSGVDFFTRPGMH